MMRLLCFIGVLLALCAPVAAQDNGPLRITISSGVREPLPYAAPVFVAETVASAQIAEDITSVIVNDLNNTGLFQEIPAGAHIGRVTNFEAPIRFSDWSPIGTRLLITGSVTTTADGQLVVKFRLWDVDGQTELGEGQQYVGPAGIWRRMAHRIADQAYSRLTGEEPYFNSRIAFIAETGAKGQRKKRLAVMDQDGANMTYLTGDETLLLAPRWSPNNRQLLYTSYQSGRPQVMLMDLATLSSRPLGDLGQVAFAPRFSPDGQQVVMSLNDGANTDIYLFDLASGQRRRLTSSPSIETAPSFSPDGTQIVFESDRSGTQQIYVMPVTGGEGQRISSGPGRYGTPVWSPRGDLIAFTKINAGRFHIGVMRPTGEQERLLTASFLEEAPTWSPNGRVIAFFRESQGEAGAPQLYSVDISGRNLRRLPTPGFASDPAWSGLLQ